MSTPGTLITFIEMIFSRDNDDAASFTHFSLGQWCSRLSYSSISFSLFHYRFLFFIRFQKPFCRFSLRRVSVARRNSTPYATAAWLLGKVNEDASGFPSSRRRPGQYFRPPVVVMPLAPSPFDSHAASSQRRSRGEPLREGSHTGVWFWLNYAHANGITMWSGSSRQQAEIYLLECYRKKLMLSSTKYGSTLPY